MNTFSNYYQIKPADHSRVDLYSLCPGISIAFNQIHDPICKNSDPEYYSDMLTANFCINGRCDVTLNNGKYAIVKENTMTLSTVPPDKDFYYPGSLYEGIQLYIKISDAYVAEGDDFLSMMGISPLKIKELFCSTSGLYLNTIHADMIEDVQSIWNLKDDMNQGMVRFYATSLFHKMLTLPKISQRQLLFTRSQIAIVEEAEKRILSDLSKKHTAKELADSFGVSESSFKLYVRGILGESYLSYFRKKRMEKAAQLLATTDLKVIEISEMVGYDNQGKFAKVFGDLYGIAPLEYRRRTVMSQSTPGPEAVQKS